MTIAHVAYLSVMGTPDEKELAKEHLQVLALLDPECKYPSLEHAARNYMQVRLTLEDNAKEDEALFKEIQANNTKMCEELGELEKAYQNMKEHLMANQRCDFLQHKDAMTLLEGLDARGGLGHDIHAMIRRVTKKHLWIINGAVKRCFYCLQRQSTIDSPCDGVPA